MSPTTLYREGTDLDDLLAELDTEYPGQVQVVEITRPREGGVLGFFARQRVGVHYRLAAAADALAGPIGRPADGFVAALADSMGLAPETYGIPAAPTLGPDPETLRAAMSGAAMSGAAMSGAAPVFSAATVTASSAPDVLAAPVFSAATVTATAAPDISAAAVTATAAPDSSAATTQRALIDDPLARLLADMAIRKATASAPEGPASPSQTRGRDGLGELRARIAELSSEADIAPEVAAPRADRGALASEPAPLPEASFEDDPLTHIPGAVQQAAAAIVAAHPDARPAVRPEVRPDARPAVRPAFAALPHVHADGRPVVPASPLGANWPLAKSEPTPAMPADAAPAAATTAGAISPAGDTLARATQAAAASAPQAPQEPAPTPAATTAPPALPTGPVITLRRKRATPAATQQNQGSASATGAVTPTIPHQAAGAHDRDTATESLRSRLALLGVPQQLIPTTPTHAYAAIEQIVANLPEAPAMPTGPGQILVLTGSTPLIQNTAEELLITTPGLFRSVWVHGCTQPRGTRIGALREERLTSAAQAASLAASARVESDGPTLVLVATDGLAGTDQAGEILTGLDADAAWAVVDATRKPLDTARSLGTVGAIDAIVACGTESTASPATTLALGHPVAMVDGRAATPSRWAVLLLSKLAELEAPECSVARC